MTHGTEHIRDGFHTVTPHLTVRGAARAIEFYENVFGATELLRLVEPTGRIVHAEIKIGDSPISIAEENPGFGNLSPQALGGSPVVLSLYVQDVDTLARQAVAAGGKILIPVSDQFYGDRGGRLEDRFGQLWIIATHKEDVSPEEMQKRFDDLMKQ